MTDPNTGTETFQLDNSTVVVERGHARIERGDDIEYGQLDSETVEVLREVSDR